MKPVNEDERHRFRLGCLDGGEGDQVLLCIVAVLIQDSGVCIDSSRVRPAFRGHLQIGVRCLLEWFSVLFWSVSQVL